MGQQSVPINGTPLVLDGHVAAECLQSVLEAEQLLVSLRGRLQEACNVASKYPVEQTLVSVQAHGSQAASQWSRFGRKRLANAAVLEVHDMAGDVQEHMRQEQGKAPDSLVDPIAWFAPGLSDHIVDQVMVDVPVVPVEGHNDHGIVAVDIQVFSANGHLKAIKPSTAKVSGTSISLAGMGISLEPSKSLQGPPASPSMRFSRCCTNLLRMVPVMHPESGWRVPWLMLGLVFIIFEVYAIPASIAFNLQMEGSLFVIMSTINSYFILDIVLSLFSGYVDTSGSVEMDFMTVAKSYLRSWFVIDVIASIPWEWLSMDTRGVEGVRLIRSLRLLRLARILRLVNQKQVSEKLELLIETNRTLVFLSGASKVIFLLFGVTHWMACAWYMVGMRDVDPEDITWVSKYVSPRWSEDAKLQRYIYSLYFCLTTMTTVGYGSPAPENYEEVCFTLVLLFVASLVFAILMGVLTDLIRSHNNEANERNERKSHLSRYMRWRAVPGDLFLTIRQHLLFLWDANEGYEEYENILKDQLPPRLKTELCFHIYGRVLQAAPFLTWMQDYQVCLKHLSTKVQSMFMSKGDLLFRVGQPNEQVYVLLTGAVWLTRNDSLVDQANGVQYNPTNLRDASSRTRDMTIPRNKEAGMLDMFSMLVHSTRNLQQNASEQLTSSVIGRLASQQNESYLKGELAGLATDAGEPKSENVFESEILKKAALQLRLRDVRQRRAASSIQTIWRRKMRRRRQRSMNGSRLSFLNGRAKKLVDSMPSKTVEAPAYFGESCLWVPLDQWSKASPPVYLYTARCESRGELVYISRDMIQEVVDRFSPWLGERFDCFRHAVLSGMETLASGTLSNGASRCFPVDWAAADLSLPDDTGALTDAQCKTLLRRPAPALPARPQERGMPAMPRIRSVSFDPQSSLVLTSAGRVTRRIGSMH